MTRMTASPSFLEDLEAAASPSALQPISRSIAARPAAAAGRFEPVALAVWGEDADAAAALAGFEAWFAEQRGAGVLALMEREVVELPLVEI